jgi:RHS repeat-associated protein
LTGVTYPGGEDVYNVFASAGIGDALNRVEGIADNTAGTTKFAEYLYLGAETIVAYQRPAVSGGLTLAYGAAGTYAGWDRFGRIVDQKWTNASGSTIRERTQYTYDRNSNRTSRTNPQRPQLSEAYVLDGLNRLVDVNRNSSDHKAWSLDSTGNWNTFSFPGTTQSRGHNAANEVTTVSGQTSPIHDAAGNVTQAASPSNAAANQVYAYDGWHRLVEVKTTAGTQIARYEYDGRGFRIQKSVPASGLAIDYYHNEASQVVEVRENGAVERVYVWDASYVDTPVVMKRDSDGNGSLDQNLYYTFDALRNVTGLILGSNGNVGERYHYESHGGVQIYSATWSVRLESLYENDRLFSGRERDSESGLYYFRARYLDPSLGRFLARDPLGPIDGPSLYNAYFVPNSLDPSGMRAVVYFDPADGMPVPAVGQPVGGRDWIDYGADFGTGFNDVLILRANRWLLSQDNSIDESSWAYKGGMVSGAAVGIAVSGAAGSAAAAGKAAAVARGVAAYDLAAVGIGMAEAGKHFYEGKATFWDSLPFLPLIGYGLGRLRPRGPAHAADDLAGAANAPKEVPGRYSGRYADGQKAYRTNVPRDAENNPLPDSEATGSHSRLQRDRVDPSRNFSATEFDEHGHPIKRIDFAGRKGDPLPHQHRYDPKTKGFGPKEPLE